MLKLEKVCTKCNMAKELQYFSKQKAGLFGRNSQCKACVAIYDKNKVKENPWMITLNLIRRRCTNPRETNYRYYGGRGIKNFLTLKDLKYLWFRDKAHEMKRPSIDRLDSNKDYTIQNSHYIEMSENIAKRNILYKGKNKKLPNDNILTNMLQVHTNIYIAKLYGVDPSTVSHKRNKLICA